MKQEIENKLREIGYTGKTDLETLLDALPAKVVHGKLTSRPQISYDRNDFWKVYYPLSEYESIGVSDESLADTASRLIVKLHEAGIINFNK